MKQSIICKCGQEFPNRKALGQHIKAEKIKVDISASHSAKREPKHEQNIEGEEA